MAFLIIPKVRTTSMGICKGALADEVQKENFQVESAMGIIGFSCRVGYQQTISSIVQILRQIIRCLQTLTLVRLDAFLNLVWKRRRDRGIT